MWCSARVLLVVAVTIAIIVLTASCSVDSLGGDIDDVGRYAATATIGRHLAAREVTP